MDAAVLKRIPNKIPCSLEYDFLPIMIGKEMFSHETTGRFIDIGTPQSFAKAERFFNQLQESH
jgi:NDP-sugar pyrophosphorylase family protein